MRNVISMMAAAAFVTALAMPAFAADMTVKGEVVDNPLAFREALARAKAATVEGKPYLIDVQVARRGIGWAEKPWTPPIKVAEMRTKKV